MHKHPNKITLLLLDFARRKKETMKCMNEKNEMLLSVEIW